MVQRKSQVAREGAKCAAVYYREKRRIMCVDHQQSHSTGCDLSCQVSVGLRQASKTAADDNNRPYRRLKSPCAAVLRNELITDDTSSCMLAMHAKYLLGMLVEFSYSGSRPSGSRYARRDKQQHFVIMNATAVDGHKS